MNNTSNDAKAPDRKFDNLDSFITKITDTKSIDTNSNEGGESLSTLSVVDTYETSKEELAKIHQEINDDSVKVVEADVKQEAAAVRYLKGLAALNQQSKNYAEDKLKAGTSTVSLKQGDVDTAVDVDTADGVGTVVNDFAILNETLAFDKKMNDEIIDIVNLTNNAMGNIKGTKGKYSGINKAMNLHLGSTTLASGAFAAWVLPLLAVTGGSGNTMPDIHGNVHDMLSEEGFKEVFSADNSGEMATAMIVLLMAAAAVYLLEEHFKKDDQDVTKDLKAEIQSQMTKFATGTPITAEAIDNIRNKVTELALKSDNGQGMPAELSTLLNKLNEKVVLNAALTNDREAIEKMSGTQGIAGAVAAKFESIRDAAMGKKAMVRGNTATAEFIKTGGDVGAQNKLLKNIVKISNSTDLVKPHVRSHLDTKDQTRKQ